MNGVLSWLVRWALHAGTRDFCPALAALVSPVQNSALHTIFIHQSRPRQRRRNTGSGLSVFPVLSGPPPPPCAQGGGEGRGLPSA